MSPIPPTDPALDTTTVTVSPGWVRSAAAGAPGQVRVLVADRVGPTVRNARVRWVPVLVEAGGRAGTTVQTRFVPAVRATGQRLGPAAARAVLRAGVTVRAATAGAVDRGTPVTREAARRGLNAWAALLGGQPVDVAAAPARRWSRTVGWIIAAGALGGGGYSAWRVLRAAENPWQDEPDPAPGSAVDPTTASAAVSGPDLVGSQGTDVAAAVSVVTEPPAPDASPGPVAVSAAEPAEPFPGADGSHPDLTEQARGLAPQ